MQRYYILLKASGGYELPVWLPYRLDADRADKALEKGQKSGEGLLSGVHDI